MLVAVWVKRLSFGLLYKPREPLDDEVVSDPCGQIDSFERGRGITMSDWAEQYVDKQVENAWRVLRRDLADRFAVGVETGEMDDIDITTPDGRMLSIQVDEDVVVLMADDYFQVTANVDEAAYDACRLLQDDWQVIHPTFLNSEVIDVPTIDDNPIEARVPVLGQAETRDELHGWVVASFNDGRDEPIVVAPNGDIVWGSEQDRAVNVSVRTNCWIEVWTVIAAQVSFKKAHRVIDRLSRKHQPVKFALHQDRIIASRVLDAGPFVPQHLFDALGMHLKLVDELDWVADKVLRKRTREAKRRIAGPRPRPPAELLGLLPAARSLTASGLADAVRTAAGSQAALEAWLPLASHEWSAAQRLPRDAAADPYRVNARLLSAWRRLYRAIKTALEADAEAGAA